VRKRTLRVSVAGLMVLGTTVATTGALTSTAVAVPGPAITTWISGLNTPRGITFDGHGNMYVSQSGIADPNHTGAPNGLSNTGSVSKYARGSTHASWVTNFESLWATIDPSAPPDVLGPEGISAMSDSCRRDDRGDDHGSGGCPIRMIMSESHDGVSAASGGAVNATQLGHLFSIDSHTGHATSVSDVGDQNYAWTGARVSLFPSDFPDSNPYGTLVTKDKNSHRVRTFVADAGANTISEVMSNGTLRVIAFIPNETAAPFRDATPTCIAQGPDGMLYVATLHFVANLFVYGSGQSDVWRVNPNATFPTVPTVWASGLTTPTSCTFDHQGNFWAAEMFQPNTAGAPGDVVRIPFHHPTHLERIGGGMVPLPGGIAQGPDGAMYVTVNSSSPVVNSGAVVRISTHAEDD
jgi:hypothetical protein